jgi:hypothetical protein
MLKRNGKGNSTEQIPDDKMAELFRQHLSRVETWLGAQPHIKTLYVDYGKILESPHEQVSQINEFFGNSLDVNKMTSAVDQALYRQRVS